MSYHEIIGACQGSRIKDSYIKLTSLASLIVSISLLQACGATQANHTDVNSNPSEFNGQSAAVHSDTEPKLEDVEVENLNIVAGQTIYVPVYSYIYHYTSVDHTMKLSTTLSIRNTDIESPIFLTRVGYYGTEGNLITEYLDDPVRLDSLQSTSFFIDVNDVAGGAGAKFIVDWVSETTVFEPIVEAVMISTASSQGISFVTSGRILSRFSLED